MDILWLSTSLTHIAPSYFSRPPITEQHITSAEQALHRTRLDLQARRAAAAQTAAGSGDASGLSSSGIMSLLTGTSASLLLPHGQIVISESLIYPSGSSQLQLELSGVEALERQMTADLISMKQRKAYAEYSRTIPGMLLNCANWGLSIYCIYRLFMVSRMNLFFAPANAWRRTWKFIAF